MNNKITSALFPFLSWWPLVDKNSIKADLGAGITNAIVVLPQGVAFAMIAGLPPIYGLYTAIVVPIIAALFGSSLHLISGPNTAVSLVFFAVLSQFAEPGSLNFIELAFVLTFISGAIQLIMGIARLGSLVNFVSNAVIIGFTTGAAVLIVTSQMKHVFGLAIPKGVSFFEVWQYLFAHLSSINYWVFGIAIATLFSALLFKRASKLISWIPHLLLAMVVGSVLAFYVNDGNRGIALIGELPSGLPSFHFPELTYAKIIELTPSAFAVALLGLIQAIAIARSIAIKSHQQLDANQEFIGEGLSNMVGSMFMCYASSGSFTRSGINYSAGAKTPLSAIFAAVALALIILLIAPLTAYLPIAAMGGIILLVAYNLIDFKVINRMIKTSKRETVVLVITFLSTLFLHLEYAIYLGVFFSLIFYLQSSAKPNIVTLAPDKESEHRAFVNIARKPMPVCPQLHIIRIDGSLFFGNVQPIEELFLSLYESNKRHVLVLGNGIGTIDLAGAELLEQEIEKWKADGRGIYFCSLRKPVREVLEIGGFMGRLGCENFFETKLLAIDSIYKRLDKNICSTCEVKIFNECNSV